MSNKELSKAFGEIHDFIEIIFLNRINSTDVVIFFECEELGNLSLNYEYSLQYNKCLSYLIEAVAKNDEISRHSIEIELQKTILKVKSQTNDSTDLKNNIVDALNSLKEKLTAERKNYTYFIPINGLKAEGLPYTIGPVQIATFDSVQPEAFHNLLADNQSQQNQQYNLTNICIKNSKLPGSICGVIEVEAKDYESAEKIAIAQLRHTLDILNFFSDITPFNPKAWVYLPSDLESYLSCGFILGGDNESNIHFPNRRIGPLGELSLARVIESDAKSTLGFEYLVKLLGKNNCNKLEKALITAIHWAGRAVLAKRREESFLLYAIALESIILADSPNSELNYRLKIRIAHLLGSDLEKRQEIFDRVNRLYKLRSKLVHDGKYEITDLELQFMSDIAIRCIKRFLIEPTFHQMKSPEDFADWSQKQVFN